ncbi:MAG: T9SS type A sorting domain-containing protein, partial [Bacteroidota bacterium]
LVHDFDGNQTADIMLGDVSFNSVVVGYNGGCVVYAFMDSVETNFPQNDSAVNVEIFPGMFYVDLNNDNVRDLILSSNSPSDGENVNGVVWYRNDGKDDSVDFRFVERGIFAGDQIDIGRASVPFFFDHNNDNLPDLLLAHASARYLTPAGAEDRMELRLYENIGDADRAAFQLIDENYLNFAADSIGNATMGGGDLDGDGDTDLLFGNTQGQLVYFKNIAPIGSDASYVKETNALTDANGDIIDVGSLSSPELFDFDGDNDLDLFIGEEHGWVNYYENQGTPQQYSFVEVSDTFGGIKLTNAFNSAFSGFSKPRFADVDGDSEAEIIVGGELGQVQVYDQIDLGLTQTLPQLDDLFGFDFGSFAAPAASVLDTAGISYVVGNRRGGLYLFSRFNDTPMDTIVSVDPPQEVVELRVFPNPTTGEFQLEFANPDRSETQIDLRNVLGQSIFATTTRENKLRIDLSGQTNGLYFIRLRQGEQSSVKRVVLTK